MADRPFLPWEKAERPEGSGPGPSRLQERLNGQQISRLYWIDEPGPTRSRALAFELTSGARMIVLAARDRNSRYAARLVFRWMHPPQIILPRMARAFSGGRLRDPEAGPPDDLQQAIEGEVISGVRSIRSPAKGGGERLEIECRGGGRLYLEAMVLEAPRRGLLADIGYVWSQPEPPRLVRP